MAALDTLAPSEKRHRARRSVVKKALVFVYAFGAAFGPLTPIASNAQAQSDGESAFNEEQPFQASDGRCLWIASHLAQYADQIHYDGLVRVRPGCASNPGAEFTGAQIAVRYTLWKWNPSTSSSWACQTLTTWKSSSVGWRTLVTGSIWFPNPHQELTYGCGDGWYNLAIEGAGFLDNAWRIHTVFSGWLNLDVNDNPPGPVQ